MPRARLCLEAVLATPAGDHLASITDISRTGVRVVGRVLPGLGEQLIFRAEQVQAWGEVVLRDETGCSIEFDTPIAAAEVQRLRWLGSAGPI